MKTLALRVERQNATGLALARWLEDQPQVRRVWYPGLESHPDYAVATRLMKGFGGVVTFELETDLEGAMRFTDACRIPYIAPSLGGVDALVEMPVLMSYWDQPVEERLKYGITDTLVRYSCGIEDAEDLQADLAQALRAIMSGPRRPGASDAHRAQVGGMFDEIGRLQLDFLIGQGLAPGDRLLDVGCGCLRGGVHFVGYLEPGHYYGIDLSADLIRAGLEVELPRAGLRGRLARRPPARERRLRGCRSFGVTFDAAWAQSVFTHLPGDVIRKCLAEVARCMRPGGRFFATFFESGADPSVPVAQQPGGHTTYPDRDPFHYRFTDLAALARPRRVARHAHRRLGPPPRPTHGPLRPALRRGRTFSSRSGDDLAKRPRGPKRRRRSRARSSVKTARFRSRRPRASAIERSRSAKSVGTSA